MKEIHTEKAKELYEKGLAYIYPQNHSEWKEQIQYRIMEDGDSTIIECALKYILSLDKGENLWAEYKRSDGYKLSDDFFAKVLKIVTTFSKRGVEFYYWAVEHRYARLVCGREERMLTKLAFKNERFSKELAEEENVK